MGPSVASTVSGFGHDDLTTGSFATCFPQFPSRVFNLGADTHDALSQAGLSSYTLLSVVIKTDIGGGDAEGCVDHGLGYVCDNDDKGCW